MRRLLALAVSLAVAGSLAGPARAASPSPDVPAAPSASVAPSAPAAPSTPATVALVPCPVGKTKLKAQCGRLQLPESAESGRTIGVRFVVIRAKRVNHGAVFEVAGGPGQSAVELAPQLVQYGIINALVRDHDVVFVDQRGTGGSRPLECPNLLKNRIHTFAQLFPAAELRACRDQLAKVADLNAYGSERAADDLDAARDALGYRTISLDAGSYGTQFSFVYLRRHPDRVRALNLTAVAPPDIKLPLPFSRGAQHAIDELIASCAAEAACRRAYPNFASEWKRLVARFARGPQPMPLVEHGGRHTTVLLSSEVFGDRMRQALYSSDASVAVPAIVHASARGDDAPLGRLVAAINDYFLAGVSLGMNLSVSCAEDVAFITPAERASAARIGFLGDQRIRAQQQACATWNVRRAPATVLEKPRSGVPILMISGADDPATPPSLAAALLPGLPNARQIVVPNGGHDNSSPCLDRLRLAFLNDPRPRMLHASCVAGEKRPPFVINLRKWLAQLPG
jgi:pimeloyl-ACP methyl ester carboxylesterase